MSALYTPAEVSAIPLFQSPAARRMQMPQEAEDHARLIAGTVAAVWTAGHGGAGLDVVLGTVAAVAFLPLLDPDAGASAAAVASLEPSDLCQLLDSVWQRLYWELPAHVELMRPLRRWLDAPEDWQAGGALLAVQTCIRTGLLEFAGDSDRALSSDLLGRLMQQLRGRADKGSTGAFHMPRGAAVLMAEILQVDTADLIVMEPAAGSGALWRAAAADLRRRGQSPGEKTWLGVEVDPLSAAVLVANAVLWRLGPNVVVARADAIRQPDSGVGAALEQRARAYARRDALFAAVNAAAVPGT
ncbi:N-6 DNA methylase [Streptacidiphilus jiangxiensis]|uniref:N-6 DNA Methylase n=1 Tax=Streptacidiphilus jiangxiensis TaxID=235985 RepID=A0A1H8B9R1_STRJI|nr:N-6 DNA methylase [Streptacidiphilus jiangxiensis]SEM79685.1 N-6 DNA Methylase [Streptacidiphilus jiangxiensis]